MSLNPSDLNPKSDGKGCSFIWSDLLLIDVLKCLITTIFLYFWLSFKIDWKDISNGDVIPLESLMTVVDFVSYF